MENETLNGIIETYQQELNTLMRKLNTDPEYEQKLERIVKQLEELIRARICYNHFFNQSELR